MVPPRLLGGHLKRARHTLLAAVIAASAAVLMLLSPGVAQADPSVSDIEAQIDVVWQQAEPLIEQYNAVHEQYEQNLARQAELQAALTPLEAQLSEARDRVGVIAAHAYRSGSGGVFAMLLNAESPGAFANQLAYLDVLSFNQQREVQDVIVLKREYDAQKAPVDALVAQLAAQDQELSARRAEIEQRIDELQQLRRDRYAETAETGSFRPWPCPAEYAPTPGYQAAVFACAQAGVPYVWAGASSSGYDCSGLTMMAWRQAGVYLPHNAASQRRSMPYVDRANLQVGDLVFYYSDLHHVSIYVGDGKVMTAPRTGDNVRMRLIGNSVHSYGRPG